MLQLPSSWPHWWIWAVFAGLLAGLDLAMSLIGAMVVKTRGTEAMTGWLLAGGAVSLVLFWVVASSLVYGDMVEMNVLWIAALLALIPIANAVVNGQPPSRRVVVGLIGMILFVALIQWPQSPPRRAAAHRRGSAPASAAFPTVAPAVRELTGPVETVGVGS